MMENNEWFDLYHTTKDKFKWFFWAYGYGNEWNSMEELSLDKNKEAMLDIMNHVWFMLPDHKFNIMENPLGWSEFLNLIEE
jgi:hypothetical protein